MSLNGARTTKYTAAMEDAEVHWIIWRWYGWCFRAQPYVECGLWHCKTWHTHMERIRSLVQQVYDSTSNLLPATIHPTIDRWRQCSTWPRFQVCVRCCISNIAFEEMNILNRWIDYICGFRLRVGESWRARAFDLIKMNFGFFVILQI